MKLILAVWLDPYLVPNSENLSDLRSSLVSEQSYRITQTVIITRCVKLQRSWLYGNDSPSMILTTRFLTRKVLLHVQKYVCTEWGLKGRESCNVVQNLNKIKSRTKYNLV